MADAASQDGLELPGEPIDRLVAPVVRFLHVEAASGFVLLSFAVAALVLANSPLAESYFAWWQTKLSIGLGDFRMSHSLQHWINDGLMALFFFVVGLEVKRELVLGELRDLKRCALPLAAALGGMIVPATVYLALQHGQPAARGWGIPMATDIAFVVGMMALLGPRIPHGLRVLVLSLAIVDDVGAILVIAIGYTGSLDLGALAWGIAAIGAVALFERLGVRSVGVYTVLGAIVWFFFHESGVHATIAGVILGLLTPARSWVPPQLLGRIVARASEFLTGDHPGAARALLGRVERAARESVSPLERLEHALHPWTSFVVMSLFAFANAGVAIDFEAMGEGVGLAVALGLLVGKPLGIVLFSALAVRTGLAALPDGVGWSALAGAGLLAGIGFTMALFIAELALEGAVLDEAKLGVLAG
jgi:NhaA family Na+:H+ antiporter